MDQDNFGRSLTTATVVYHSAQHAQAAQREFNQNKIMNSTITVEFARPKPFVPRTKKIFKREREWERDEGGFRDSRPQGKPFRRGNFRGRQNKN